METRNYGINIAGVEVTSENCNNITGEYITGSVSYNDESKTLTLNDATIEGRIRFNDGVEDITITLVGSNYAYSIGSVTNTKIINGSGSLKLHRIDCYKEQNTLIEGCTIIINRRWLNAIRGGSKLTIRNANLFVESTALATTIENFKDIELIGCEIVEPVNARIVEGVYEYGGYVSKYICDADGNIVKKVVIKKKEE